MKTRALTITVFVAVGFALAIEAVTGFHFRVTVGFMAGIALGTALACAEWLEVLHEDALWRINKVARGEEHLAAETADLEGYVDRVNERASNLDARLRVLEARNATHDPAR